MDNRVPSFDLCAVGNLEGHTRPHEEFVDVLSALIDEERPEDKLSGLWPTRIS